MIDSRVRFRGDRRLGVQRHAGAGQADHVEVVGAVAYRDGVGRRQPAPGGDLGERCRFGRPAEDRFGDLARQPPIRLDQPVTVR